MPNNITGNLDFFIYVFCVLCTVYGVLHLYVFHKCIKIHSLIIKFDGLEIEGALLRPSTGNRILG